MKGCIEAKQHHTIDPSIDGGNWYEIKRRQKQANQTAPAPPILPIFGWKKFPTASLPDNFNYGHIHHHIIESVQSNCIGDIHREDKSDSEENDTNDVHTAKPLRKGKCFFTSGHVKNMNDYQNDNHYFVKCQVQASYAKAMYNVTCTLSKQTGFVIDASCTCRASSLARCNHVCALLYALLDYKEKFANGSEACTSKPCSWNQGRKTKNNPKPLHKAEYATYKKRKIDELYEFDPSPPSMRSPFNQTEWNAHIVELQKISAQYHNSEPCMMQTLVPMFYDDFTLNDYEKDILEIQGMQLLLQLKDRCENKSYPKELVKEQHSESWFLERRVRITASQCHRVANIKSAKAKENYVEEKLWSTTAVTSKAMTYGIESEPIAREQYLQNAKSKVPGYNVLDTGLWANAEHPEFACSPDGLVLDPRENDHKYGLLEIKCPSNLKDKDVHEYTKVLTSKQRASFCLSGEGASMALKKSHAYYYQVQMQLAIMGLHWCDFVVWSSKGFFTTRVQFDSSFWSGIYPKLKNFHKNVLVPELFLMRLPRKLSLLEF